MAAHNLTSLPKFYSPLLADLAIALAAHNLTSLPKFYSPLLADLAIALAAHILTSGSVGIIDSPGTDSSFSSEDFLPERILNGYVLYLFQ